MRHPRKYSHKLKRSESGLTDSVLKQKSKTLEPEAIKRIAEMALCRRDRLHHIENHFKIKNKRGEIILMKPLKKAQKMLHAVLHHCREVWKIPARVLVLKSRKTGISTFVEADMLLQVLSLGQTGIVIAHDIATAQTIHEILKRFYDQYDLSKPEIKRSNKKELQFVEHDGYIEVMTASRAHAARGRTPQYLHSSEGAFWERGAEAATALFQSMSKDINTTHVFESTPSGEDPLFKPLWDEAAKYCTLTWEHQAGELIPRLDIKDPDLWNGFVPLYISALDDEDCYIATSHSESDRIMQTLTEREQWLVKSLGATPEFIKWHRRTLAHECRGNLDIMRQEYSCSPTEAFLMSGRPRFDTTLLNSQPVEKGLVGRLELSKSWDRRPEFILDRMELLTVFKRPILGHKYVIGVDTAEGIVTENNRDPDESVIQILDVDEGGMCAQVAVFAGRESEEFLVTPLHYLAQWYNEAYIIIEVVSHGQHLQEEILKVYRPDRIYRRLDSSGDPVRGEIFGWKTHEGNRKSLLDGLAALLHSNSLIIRSESTVDQLKHIIRSKKGRYEASPGHHDDHVMALAMAVAAMDTLPPDMGKNYSDIHQQRNYQRSLTSGRGRDSTTGY